MKKRNLAIIIVAAVLLAGGITYYQKGVKQEVLPPAQNHNTFTPTPSPTPTQTLPSEINLNVPFTTQAPKVNWDEDHEEFCEEASILMAAAYINDFGIPSADFADTELYKIKDLEMSEFGYFKDTTAMETSTIFKKYSGSTNVQLVSNPSLQQIKQTLASGKIIIAPFAGRQLGNPNFTGDGPLYHMLVIKGYTKDGKIITNDPGTRKGSNYMYDSGVIMKALHDWNGGDVNNGQKIIIVVG